MKNPLTRLDKQSLDGLVAYGRRVKSAAPDGPPTAAEMQVSDIVTKSLLAALIGGAGLRGMAQLPHLFRQEKPIAPPQLGAAVRPATFRPAKEEKTAEEGGVVQTLRDKLVMPVVRSAPFGGWSTSFATHPAFIASLPLVGLTALGGYEGANKLINTYKDWEASRETDRAKREYDSEVARLQKRSDAQDGLGPRTRALLDGLSAGYKEAQDGEAELYDMLQSIRDTVSAAWRGAGRGLSTAGSAIHNLAPVTVGGVLAAAGGGGILGAKYMYDRQREKDEKARMQQALRIRRTGMPDPGVYVRA